MFAKKFFFDQYDKNKRVDACMSMSMSISMWYLGKIQWYLGPNTGVFGTKTVVFETNTVVFGIDTGVFVNNLVVFGTKTVVIGTNTVVFGRGMKESRIMDVYLVASSPTLGWNLDRAEPIQLNLKYP